jgi:hypothetical protein
VVSRLQIRVSSFAAHSAEPDNLEAMQYPTKSRTLIFITGLPLVLFAAAGLWAQSVRIEDTSDWWSIINPKFPYPKTKLLNKDIPVANFQINGFKLRTVTFEQVAAKFGKAKIVDRGDASIGRSQACYVSSDSPVIHFIFEYAEDQTIVYLFQNGADWKGSRFCVRSSQVSGSISTASGLRIGLSPAEVKSILGKPDLITGDRYIYERLVERKFTPEAFDRFRKNHPEIPTKDARTEFDFPLGLYIEVRFADSRLSYLALAMTGTADG